MSPAGDVRPAGMPTWAYWSTWAAIAAVVVAWRVFDLSPAVLTAIWAPELALQKEVLSLTLQNERLLAGVVAIAVAWRSHATFATIVSGLLALHLFDWLI